MAEDARQPAPSSDASTHSAAARPGDRVGENYRLLRVLGRGGMGDVWLAHNDTLDVEVAIKLVHPSSRERDAGERLLSEARAAARLEHPAIVRVFDFGTTESGEPYIVMERLDGEDLASAFGRLEKLNPVKAVRTLLPIAHALAAAHGKGIVHRDLKPENVFLARMEGEKLQPKVVDFGIAQVDRAPLSRTGGRALYGSPTYMAPEQARGTDVDARADIWSFCVVLYEAVSGKKPFSRATPEDTLRAIETEPLPPVPGLDDGLAAILERGLAKARDARFGSMRELGEALAAWLLARDVTEDIAGASIEASWRERPSGGLGDPASSRAAPRPSEVSATVVRARVPEPIPAPARGNRLVLGVAAGAAFAGVALGVLFGLQKPPKNGVSAPDPSASAGAGTHGEGPRIPVAPLEAIPVDSASPPSPSAREPGGERERAPKPLRRPKRPLKDPFH